MKVKVIKEYIGRNSGLLHKVGAIDEWSTVGKYGRALIENGFVEVVEEYEEWKPGPNEAYFTPNRDSFNQNMPLYYDGDCADRSYVELGLAFKSQGEADRMAEWLKAVKILRQDSQRSMRRGTSGHSYGVWWNITDFYVNFYTHSSRGWRALANPFPFATEEDAKASIKAHEKEWKIFLGVE